MKTNVESIAYADGRRIETLQQIYTQGDDYAMLGRLYMALGEKLTRRELSDNDEEKNLLDREIDTLHGLIAKQQEYLAGYEGISNE